ncbi:hypothetical protein EIP91_002044 [Steccherinum ochraceum]|uniref:FAS1 domain-containing protein n=1 Tax=Steccherinum ochraceum TaxID=92696 RepID=A0A4R0RTK1_9APHY|nr:hypothetical protein EIP91_002044 [Steccherinum ochraceum]
MASALDLMSATESFLPISPTSSFSFSFVAPVTMLTLPLFAVAALPVVVAQANTTFLAEVVSALSGAGLTSIASIALNVNSTAVGQSVLANISNGTPHLLFAPTNQALQAISLTDNNTLADTLAYHVVPGNFSSSVPTYPNTTLGRTLLTDGNFVQLEGGNKAQVVAWATRADKKIHVLNQKNDSTVVNSTSVGNLTIWIIDHVLQIPQDFSTTVLADNLSLTGVDTVLKSVQTPFFNSTTNSTGNITLFDAFTSAFHGFTFFAPNASAIQTVQSQLQALNTSEAQNLIYNHLLNGTTVYSPNLASQSFTTAAGETLSFIINSTGQFITDKATNITAKIVQPDVLLPNGVVHVIDRVLFDTNIDASAASSAVASATSAATASQSSQTAPIGFSQTSGLASPTNTSNHALPAFGMNWSVLVVAIGVVFGAVVTVV